MTRSNGRILVVDDDLELRGLLQRYLSENGFEVRAVPDTRAMDQHLQREPFDAMVLDLMMPVEDGLSACRRLRAAGQAIPIIILTAKGDPIDRIIGIETGADDYMAKPFEPRELLARIGAVLRRTSASGSATHGGKPIQFGPYALDMEAMTLTRDGMALELSSREFSLLSALAVHIGRPVSRARIIDTAFGRDAEVTDRAVDVQVTRLRKSIGEDSANPVWIKTVWGVGYMLAKDAGA
jgi:two-component system, OmpR family, phosphate regulon response regulator OmpR